MRSRRRPPPAFKIVAYSRAKRVFSPNNYVIEYENELARFPHNPSSASRHLSRCQRGGLHNSPALAAWGGTVFHGGQMESARRGGRSRFGRSRSRQSQLLPLSHVSNGSDRSVREPTNVGRNAVAIRPVSRKS